MSPLAAGVRPGRCPYCGRPCNGATCRAHSDLPALDVLAQARPVDKPVETVDERIS